MVATLDQVFREEWGRVLVTLRGWLMTTARNQATDRIRRDRALATMFGLLVVGSRAEVPMKTTTFPDERLELIFTCCNPALAVEAQVALTLRTLGGLTTDEIATRS